MAFKDVYIVRSSLFLPNEPVSNDDMESYLGVINGKPSRSRRIVLRNNGIQRRFYALKKGGESTHTNAELTSLAVKELFQHSPAELEEIELLTCGTSSPDQMMPAHGLMVHGWLPDADNIDVYTAAGNCCAGMHALKYAYMAVKTGEVSKAVSTGSERTSKLLCSSTFEDEAKKLSELESNPYLSFDKDFLRWMLSDGAGAFLLTDKKRNDGISLKIEWIEGTSYAHKVESCMYMASDKDPDGKLKSFKEFSPHEIANKSIMAMKQDVKLLDKHIVPLAVETLEKVFTKHNVKSAEIDYFLPHLSSEFFRKKLATQFEEAGINIPQEKWFSNLTQVGNIGAASIYAMLNELMNSGRLQKGQMILLGVPESARFTYVYALLKVC